MNNQQFFNSFFFHTFQFTKNRHTDNCTRHGAIGNFIGVLLRGSGRLVHAGGTMTLEPGEVVFIPKGFRYHSYWNTDAQGSVQWHSISFDCFPAPEGQRFTLQKLTLDEAATALLQQITATMEHTPKSIGLLYCFLAQILPGMQLDTDPHTLTVQKAIGCMREDPHGDMETIAARCGVSASTLYAAFRHSQNTTPNHVRQQLLCEKAVQLLCTTGLSVEEISSRLGFSSSSYFRKVLRQHTGKTPRQLRSSSQTL